MFLTNNFMTDVTRRSAVYMVDHSVTGGGITGRTPIFVLKAGF